MPVQRLSLAVPKLSHIPHAESLAISLLQVSYQRDAVRPSR